MELKEQADGCFDYYSFITKRTTDQIEFELREIEASTPTLKMMGASYKLYNETRLGKHNYYSQDTSFEGRSGMVTVADRPMEEYNEKVNDRAYKREWKYLNEFNKRYQIVKFLESLNYPAEMSDIQIGKQVKKNTDILCKAIADKIINNKKNNKKNVVVYDKEIGEIIEIKCLFEKEHNGYYVDLK